jgi:hypothetical protein
MAKKKRSEKKPVSRKKKPAARKKRPAKKKAKVTKKRGKKPARRKPTSRSIDIAILAGGALIPILGS